MFCSCHVIRRFSLGLTAAKEPPAAIPVVDSAGEPTDLDDIESARLPGPMSNFKVGEAFF